MAKKRTMQMVVSATAAMAKLKILMLVTTLSVASSASAAGFYKLDNLQRVNQDTYTTDTHVIKTRYCYEYVYGERAILKWVGPGEYAGNRLIFRSGAECDVKALYRKAQASTQCNSSTGNTAADIVNNAQCRNMQAQVANQRHDRELARAQRRLDQQKRELAAARAQMEAFQKQSEAQIAAVRRQAEAARAMQAQYQRIANYIRSENARIAKIKNPKKRAAAQKKLQREIQAIRAALEKQSSTGR